MVMLAADRLDILKNSIRGGAPTSAPGANVNQQVNTSVRSSSSEPGVWMNSSATWKPSYGAPSEAGAVAALRASEAAFVTADDARLELARMTGDELRDLGRRMFNLGLIRDPGDLSAIRSAWNEAVFWAQQNTAVGKRVTPWQALEMLGGISGQRNANVYTGPRKTVETLVEQQIPTRLAIKRGVRAVFQDAVGRDPTTAEMKHYSNLIHNYAQEHPRVTRDVTRVTGTKGAIVTGRKTTRTTTGGATSEDYAQLAIDRAEHDPEFGAYQAVTKYYNAFIQALGAPV